MAKGGYSLRQRARVIHDRHVAGFKPADRLGKLWPVSLGAGRLLLEDVAAARRLKRRECDGPGGSTSQQWVRQGARVVVRNWRNGNKATPEQGLRTRNNPRAKRLRTGGKGRLGYRLPASITRRQAELSRRSFVLRQSAIA
jgi:hypothetical protein